VAKMINADLLLEKLDSLDNSWEYGAAVRDIVKIVKEMPDCARTLTAVHICSPEEAAHMHLELRDYLARKIGDALRAEHVLRYQQRCMDEAGKVYVRASASLRVMWPEEVEEDE